MVALHLRGHGRGALVDGRAPVHAVAPAVDQVGARALIRRPARRVILPVRLCVAGVRVPVAFARLGTRVEWFEFDVEVGAIVVVRAKVVGFHAAGVGGGHAEEVIAEVEVASGAVTFLLERLYIDGRVGEVK